jgi:hypothetical protein
MTENMQSEQTPVMFETVGEKRLAVDFVVTHRLLTVLDP